MKPEKMTAEAFDTVQGALHSFLGLIRIHYAKRTECDGSMERGCLSGLGALTLLERRMGAMAAALREVLELHHRMPDDVTARIQTALSAAPPVFTLEEVEANASELRRLMVLDAIWSDAEWRAAAERFFSAMRKG